MGGVLLWGIGTARKPADKIACKPCEKNRPRLIPCASFYASAIPDFAKKLVICHFTPSVYRVAIVRVGNLFERLTAWLDFPHQKLGSLLDLEISYLPPYVIIHYMRQLVVGRGAAVGHRSGVGRRQVGYL